MEKDLRIQQIKLMPGNVVDPKTLLRIEVKVREYTFDSEKLYCGEMICASKLN